jgi:hydroxymethylpyrimidine pyrophosphatase-like HAD family hydrolase
MKNADEAHKTDCRTVTEYTNDEDGVARFLAEYFSL